MAAMARDSVKYLATFDVHSCSCTCSVLSFPLSSATPSCVRVYSRVRACVCVYMHMYRSPLATRIRLRERGARPQNHVVLARRSSPSRRSVAARPHPHDQHRRLRRGASWLKFLDTYVNSPIGDGSYSPGGARDEWGKREFPTDGSRSGWPATATGAVAGSTFAEDRRSFVWWLGNYGLEEYLRLVVVRRALDDGTG